MAESVMRFWKSGLPRVFLLLALAIVVTPDTAQAAVTYFASASNPADGNNRDLTVVPVTPPGAMQSGDLVILVANAREAGQTLTMSAAGGQAWISQTANTTNTSQRIFWARFNGTWSANPSVSFPAGANGTTLVMHVFRPSSGANTWALDVAQTNASFAAPAPPRNVTIAGITTGTDGALVFATWATPDNNTWALQTAGWANAGLAQYRNGDGNDASQSAAYKVMATAGASGNVTNRQATLGGDAGNTSILAFKEVPVPVAVSSFNAFEPPSAPTTCATLPVATVSGPIKTKVAGATYPLCVVALNSTPQIETTFNDNVKVEVVPTSNCLTTTTVLATMSPVALTDGRASVSFSAEPEAWRDVSVRISYPAASPTIVKCSGDNFAIRPSAFVNVSVADQDWQTAYTTGTSRTLYNTAATDGNVHKAGQPFTLIATAVNAAATPAATANYNGSPEASLTTCLLPAAPTTCALGTLSPGTWSADAGTVTSTTATYSEVGAFTMKLVDTGFASVDASDSSEAERYIESAAFDVGRFVPDHFDLGTANTPEFKTFNDATCTPRSFTYIGQPFGFVTAPQATIAAKNASGATTANYRGALWKLAAADLTQTYSYTLNPVSTPGLNTGLIGTPTVTSNSDGTGTAAANSGDRLAFTRSTTTPLAPFTAAIDLSMSVADSSENGVTGNGIIGTSTPASFSSIAFDSGNAFRYGRIRLANAYGSELLDLPIPMGPQYWNGTAFVNNAADACTRFAAADFSLGNYQRNLSAGETTVSISGGLPANLKLTKPGAGNNGSVDLTLNLDTIGKSYLQGKWTGTTFTENPAARATFGIYKTPLIYLRENY